MLRLGKGCVPHCLRPQSLQSGVRGLHVRSPVLQGVAADQPRAPRTWRAPVFGEPYQRQLALAPPTGSMLHRSVTDTDLAAWPITHLTRLDNGLRVATEEGVGETAAVGVFIDTGSRYETSETNGVAHFLEHMFFKGTPKRSVHQLEVEIENMGGHLNAYTSREQTVFYMRVLKKDVPQAMDILADTLQNSIFDQDMITQESYTIMREMEEVEKQDEEVIFDRLHQTAFRGCSLARTILGPAENILNMKREHLLNYVRTHYTTPRMVVAGAGAVKHQDLCRLSQSLFTKFPAEPPAGLVVHKEPAQHIGGDIRVRDDDKEAATLAVAFATPGWTSGENIVLLVMQTMLGSWSQNSANGAASLFPLVSQVAANDLAHSFAAFNTQYSDIGLFGVHARADKFQLWELTSAIMHYMTSFCYEVDETLLNAAKHQLVSSVLGSLDNCQGTCEDIGRQMLTYGRRMHPIEFVKRIQAVDAAAIKATANRYIYDQDVSMACLGPVHEMPDYNRLRSNTYWLRK